MSIAGRNLPIQLAIAAIVFGLVLPPLLVLVIGSISANGPGDPFEFSLENIQDAASNIYLRQSFFNSLIFASITATLVTVLGIFLAWVVERTDSRFARFAQLFAVVPILIPAVTLVSAWIMLLSPRGGLINIAWQSITGSTTPLVDIFSFSGMIWVATLQELPLAFLWLWPVFKAINPDLEEAARVSGASAWKTFFRVTLPILKPAIIGGWLIFFIYALGALSVPVLIGLPARIFLYSTEIYVATTRIPTQYGLASLYSLFFLIVTVVAVVIYNRIIGNADRFSTIRGKAYRPRRSPLGPWRIVVDGVVFLILLLVAALPMMILLWNSLMPYPQLPSFESLRLMTLQNFTNALNYGPAMRAIWNSLWIGILAGVLTTALGFAIAWMRLRMDDEFRIVAMTEQVGMMPIAIPGMIVGVSFLWFYLMIPVGIYASPWILLLAYIVLHLPYAIRICASGLVQLHPELDEAGRVSGAGTPRVMISILLPLVAPAVAAAAIYVSLRSFREYAASIFLTAPGTEVFSVVVLDMWQGGNSNTLAAYTIMVMVLLGVLVGLGNMLSARLGVKSNEKA